MSRERVELGQLFVEAGRIFLEIGKRMGADPSLVMGPRVATDAQMSGPKGDPECGINLRDWKGPLMKGRKFSMCPPEYLDQLAEYLQYRGENPKEGKEKYAKFDLLDAARARGWAARIRAATPDATPAPTGAPSTTEPEREFTPDEGDGDWQ